MPFDRRASMKSQVIFWRWLGQLESEPKGTNENVSHWTGSMQSKPAERSVFWILPFFFHSVNIYWLSSTHQTLSWALEIQPVKLPVQWVMAQWLWLSLFLPCPMSSSLGSVRTSTSCCHTLCTLASAMLKPLIDQSFIIPQSHSSPEATSTLHLKCFWLPPLQTLSQILTLMEVSSVLYAFFLNCFYNPKLFAIMTYHPYVIF